MKTPLTQYIQGGLREGNIITVKGRVLLGADRFYVNLQCGDGPKADVALHLSAKFDRLPGYVTLNTCHQQIWSKESKYESPIPRGSTFTLKIMVNRDSFMVYVNGIFFLEYPYRLPVSSVNTICVDGGLDLESVELPNAGMNPPANPQFGGYGFSLESPAYNQGAFSAASACNQGASSGAFAYTEGASSGALAHAEQQYYGAPRYSRALSSGALAYSQALTSGNLSHSSQTGICCVHAKSIFRDHCQVFLKKRKQAFAYTQRTSSLDSPYGHALPPVAPVYHQAPSPVFPVYHQAPPPVAPTYHQAPAPVAPAYHQAPAPVAPAYHQAPPSVTPIYNQPLHPTAPTYNQAQSSVAVAYTEATRGIAVAFVQGASAEAPQNPNRSSSTAAACSMGPPLVTPFKRIMEGGMYHGKSITVKGVVNLNVNTFFISLRFKNGVAFQFSPKFDKSKVVCNSQLKQKWGSEERTQGLPFCKGKPFTVNIVCEVTGYRVSIDNIQTITFKHRYTMLNEIDILEIEGDVSLTSVEC